MVSHRAAGVLLAVAGGGGAEEAQEGAPHEVGAGETAIAGDLWEALVALFELAHRGFDARLSFEECKF
jgi:hypothetical protein